ncbi:MAG: dienelactone hydrolase family protein [Phenylobacterium sp.]|uniref:dienelactone hydrolase family protein n=1 Tax=Phenylobacterium sp. TaxID=1871053 RepID=UPI002736A20C|nr:dienelactone hydrolase family protein [Phenylobacterium sp.]MDP3174157.1 dienelactone hydrolase family protein [Phenylobacterium sp.]
MGETITITTEDGAFSAYLARPASTPAPAIIVLQEIFGVNAGLRQICDNLAGEGFLAVCPDLFWRLEPGIELTDQTPEDWKKAFALMNAFDVDQGMVDVAAVVDQVRDLDECSGKVGAVGFCLGGLLAFLTATRTDVDASVAYYGVGIENRTVEIEKLAQPLMMHIAEDDQFVPKEAQAIILQAMKNDQNIEIHTYPGRNHAFAREGGEHYNEADAKLAAGRTLSFFKTHLG